MEQPHISYIHRIVAILENILKDMNQPPLDENPLVTVDRSGLPEEIKITFQRTGAATLDIRINESEVVVSIGDGLYKTSEESHFIVHNIPDYFEDEISMYLIYPIQIFINQRTRGLAVRDEEGNIIYQTPYIQPGELKDATIYSYQPLIQISTKKIEEFFIRQQIRYAKNRTNESFPEQLKIKGRINLPVSELSGYYDFNWWWGILLVAILITALWVPLRYDFAFLGALAVLFILFWQSRRWQLKLRKYQTSCTPDQLEQAFMETAIELNWSVMAYDPEKYMIASRTSHQKHLCIQERIYILKDKDGILLQSIPSPTATLGYLSSERNKENIETFLKNLKAIVTKESHN